MWGDVEGAPPTFDPLELTTISSQPSTLESAILTQAIIPSELEPLNNTDQILIQQKADPLDDWDASRKYTIKDSTGTNIYYAAEKSNICYRSCCGRRRPYQISILDTNLKEVIHIKKPLLADCCCFFCCLQHLDVYAPKDCYVGKIEQEWSICRPKYGVKLPSGEKIFRILGPCCTTSWCGADVAFSILTNDESEQVGLISKQWSGLLKELFTVDDFLGVSFKTRLEVRVKALLLGACFLLDSMFYESDKSSNQF